MRTRFIASVTGLYYEANAEQQPKQGRLELANPSEQDVAMAGICLGMEPGSKAYTSVLEMNSAGWHHFILHCEFWFQVKDKKEFLSKCCYDKLLCSGGSFCCYPGISVRGV